MLGLIVTMFLVVPCALVVAFFSCLKRFQAAKKQILQDPGSIDTQEVTKRKILMIVFAVLAAVSVLVVLSCVVLFYLAIAFM